ncbi:MAG: hypothetical protein MK102_18430 [Fuerstiella sp.]|nr:hypothetical protein [Fuerstiella sp.]
MTGTYLSEYESLPSWGRANFRELPKYMSAPRWGQVPPLRSPAQGHLATYDLPLPKRGRTCSVAIDQKTVAFR